MNCFNQKSIRALALAALLAMPLLTPSTAKAVFNLGGGEAFGIIFQGGGNNTLQITNVTIDGLNGNIGVAGTGQATISGPSSISGNVYFAAANTGQFSSNNNSNSFNGGVGPQGTSYQATFNHAPTQSAMNFLNNTSQTAAGFAGTSVAIANGTTLNASAGAVFTLNLQMVHVFNATSFQNGGNQTLTINGSANDLVVINLGGLGNIQVHGDINLTGGIGADNVIFNVGGGNYITHTGAASLDINNNGGSAGIARGIFLNPNGAMSAVNAEIFGRLFGGDAHDFQYVSGAHLTVPGGSVPDGGSALALLSIGLAFLVGAKRKFLA
jgi:hypothetical protein